MKNSKSKIFKWNKVQLKRDLNFYKTDLTFVSEPNNK